MSIYILPHIDVSVANISYCSSVSMALVSPNAQFVNVITSEPSLTASSADLLSVIYTRVKKDSPDYNTVYEGIDQIVDVRFSTFVVHAAPEPIISLYDFIISTFVSDVNRPATNSPNSASSAEQPSTDESKIRVLVKLESIRGQSRCTRSWAD